tara:strand:+ start:146 stop:712 length:567 start_codon:yes stop_codon:yes gene_type:complete
MTFCTPIIEFEPPTLDSIIDLDARFMFSSYRSYALELELTTVCLGTCPQPWGPVNGPCPPDYITTPTIYPAISTIFKKYLNRLEYSKLKAAAEGPPSQSAPYRGWEHVGKMMRRLFNKYDGMEAECQADLDNRIKNAEAAALLYAILTDYCACPEEDDHITGASLARKKRMENFPAEYDENLTRAKFY